MKEPSVRDAEGSGQPLTTAVFPPAGSSRSLAQAGNFLPLEAGVTLPLLLLALFKNFHAVQSDGPVVYKLFWEEKLPPSLPISRVVSLSKGPGGGRGRDCWIGLISDATSPEVNCY